MPQWLLDVLESSRTFMPHGHCYFWMPSLLWLHAVSDTLIGIAYIGISLVLTLLVRRIRLPFSPIFIAFGLFIGLCGLTHFIEVWTIWIPDYWLSGFVKAATALASVATALGLLMIRPQVEAVVNAARLSEERRVQLEFSNTELTALYQKVKELDKLKTEFFANVSHELRTPLSLILGPIEHLIKDHTLTSLQKRQLETISRNGKSLLKQVNDLLDLAKLEEGKMKAHPATVDLGPLFRRITAQFELAAEQRDITYQVSTPETLLVEIDQGMFERVLVNLLSNGFKFTPHHGQVSVDLKQTEEGFCFAIADSGPGIDAEQHQSIFERFHQIDGSATREHSGSGLGLAIAKDFVDLHGGRIELDSALGRGSKFSVYIPQTQTVGALANGLLPPLTAETQVALDAALNELRPADERSKRSDNEPSSARAKVLVVEDTRAISDLIVDVLEEQYQVECAFDGREAMQKAPLFNPDLIVTDLMMPVMSGEQLLKELRADPQFNTVPVLLLTAKADDDLRVELLKNGAQDYLTKPFLPQELMARAGNLIATKRAGDVIRQELLSASSDIEMLARQLVTKHNQLQLAVDATEVAREQAERANQIKSHFLAMMSHELRTPLSTIIMSAQLLSRQQEGASPTVLQARLERMIRAAQQLSSLVEGVLEYSRVESGKMVVQREPVNVAALTKDVVDLIQLQSSSEQVSITLLEPLNHHEMVATDSRLLRVILHNLLSNALKFTRKGVVTLRINSTEKEIRFEVQDTGVGISQADLSRIFLPFEQLEPLSRKSIPGIGLGLALTKELTEALGGKIEVLSFEGVGSTFTVTLPKVAQV